MPAAAVRRLRAHLGRRGTVLLLLGAGKICFGVGVIAAPPPSPGLELLLRYAPMTTWALVWIVAGVVVFASAWVRIGRDVVGFVAACVPPLVWAVSYGTAAAQGTYPRGVFVFGWYLTSHIGVILWASTVPEHSIPHPASKDEQRE